MMRRKSLGLFPEQEEGLCARALEARLPRTHEKSASGRWAKCTFHYWMDQEKSANGKQYGFWKGKAIFFGETHQI